jgi:hypothetical protein
LRHECKDLESLGFYPSRGTGERELADAKKVTGSFELLRQGETPEVGATLSPHDRGRLGEINTLAEKVNAGDASATRETPATAVSTVG